MTQIAQVGKKWLSFQTIKHSGLKKAKFDSNGLRIQKNGSNSPPKSKVKLKDVCTRIHDFH